MPSRGVECLDLGQVEDVLAVGCVDLGWLAAGQLPDELVVVDVRPAGPLAQGPADGRLAGPDHTDEEHVLRTDVSHRVMVAAARAERRAPALRARSCVCARPERSRRLSNGR